MGVLKNARVNFSIAISCEICINIMAGYAFTRAYDSGAFHTIPCKIKKITFYFIGWQNAQLFEKHYCLAHAHVTLFKGLCFLLWGYPPFPLCSLLLSEDVL